MKEVVGIKLKSTNQIGYIETTRSFSLGEMLVVDGGKGQFIFECVREKEKYNKYAHKLIPIKSVRIATHKDLEVYLKMQEKKEQFKKVFLQMVKQYQINLELIDIEFSLRGDHVRYTYFSIEKLEFPKLVKYLLTNNPKRAKIEFYQVGEREYYAIDGGLGVCGYELCCHTRGHNTPTITTTSLEAMGIDVNLKKSLTGTCGKYKCCLLFESSEREALKLSLPDLDDEFIYNKQKVVVTEIDINRRIVTVVGDQHIELEFDYFMKGYNVNNK